MKQLARIFLLIFLFISICGQILFGQQTKSKEDVCIEEIFPLYKAYFEERDSEEKFRKAKLYLEKADKLGCELIDDYVNPNVRKFVKRRELVQVYNKCVDADKTYFSSPNLANLNALITACGAWIEKVPTPDHYYSTRLALATGFGVLAGFYKDTDQTFLFAEKALEKLADEATPKEWTAQNWLQFRRENIGRLLQYQGLCKLRQPKIDAESAIIFFTKAADLKDGTAYKDPNTYLLRAEANMMYCPILREAFDEAREKNGTKNKFSNESCTVTEKIVQDYARVIAITTSMPSRGFEDVYKDTPILWNLIHPTSSGKKLDDLINFYKAEFRKK